MYDLATYQVSSNLASASTSEARTPALKVKTYQKKPTLHTNIFEMILTIFCQLFCEMCQELSKDCCYKRNSFGQASFFYMAVLSSSGWFPRPVIRRVYFLPCCPQIKNPSQSGWPEFHRVYVPLSLIWLTFGWELSGIPRKQDSIQLCLVPVLRNQMVENVHLGSQEP